MNPVEFTRFLVQELIKNKEALELKIIGTDEEFITIQVLVSNEDIKRVIGKEGSTINAIRTIVQMAAYNNNKKKIKINIDAF